MTLTTIIKSAYRFFGIVGFSMAVALCSFLTSRMDLSFFVLGGMVVVVAAAFFSSALGTKLMTGHETHVYYRCQNVILASCALFLWLGDAPILRYLDITIIGIGAFLVCGRIGCLVVGCCHGRPSRFGVRYSKEHAEESFAHCLVGVRLFPVQAIEATIVAVLVGIGCVIAITGAPGGEVFSFFIISYGAARFFLELARGDSARSYFLGFSEAQWTSIALMVMIVTLDIISITEYRLWHAAVTGAVLLSAACLGLIRSLDKKESFELGHPEHLEEIAEFISGSRDHDSADMQRLQTSFGFIISNSEARDNNQRYHLYALSHRDRPLSDRGLRIFIRIISILGGHLKKPQIISRGRDVFHLIYEE